MQTWNMQNDHVHYVPALWAINLRKFENNLIIVGMVKILIVKQQDGKGLIYIKQRKDKRMIKVMKKLNT